MAKTPAPAVINTVHPTSNRLLARLPRAEMDKLAPWMQPLELIFGAVIFHPDVLIEHVYFLTSGSISTIIESPEGAVEVASVGNEGMVGVAALLHADSMPTRAFVQSAGYAFRIEVAVFRAVVAESLVMQQLFSRYTLSFMNQVAQSVACNRLHSLEARCARWLLMAHDRVDGDQILLTQESLSYMLGVHRPAVTLAAGVLQKAGYTGYMRGKISITDRRGLESASCSCYQSVREGFEALIGAVAIATPA
jgi:CRP-like cAMP-binding protein